MQLFYKTITKWFSVQDSAIHALGMLLDFRKALKYIRLGLVYFYVSENRATSRVHGKPLSNPARKTTQ